MFKILFVCTGNICRSPTAEGIMRDLIKKEALEKSVFVDSAGTSTWHHGNAPDKRSAECAFRHGIDLCDLRARAIRAEDFAEFDLILVADEANIRDLNRIRPNGDEKFNYAKVKKLLEYAPSYGENIPDPYYKDGFDDVFEMIESACKNLLAEIKLAQN